MRRPRRTPRRVQVNIRLLPDTFNKLKDICDQTGMSQSKLIEQLLSNLAYTPARIEVKTEALSL